MGKEVIDCPHHLRHRAEEHRGCLSGSSFVLALVHTSQLLWSLSDLQLRLLLLFFFVKIIGPGREGSSGVKGGGGAGLGRRNVGRLGPGYKIDR